MPPPDEVIKAFYGLSDEDVSDLDAMVAEARKIEMTPAEIEAQRQSWVRGMTGRCEHGKLDFEQCRKCRPTS